MTALLWIFVWMGAGLAARSAGLGAGPLRALSRLTVLVPLPALVVVSLRHFRWRAEYWGPALSAWLVILAALALFRALGRRRGWAAGTTGALVMTAGFSNTSFVGFPLIRALRGEEAMPLAVIVDRLGSFLALSTVGIAAAGYFASGRPSLGAALRRFAVFPSTWALVAAFLVKDAALPAAVEAALRAAASLLAPLALFCVGAQLRLRRPGPERRAQLAWGLGFKLAAAPAGVGLLLAASGVGGRALDVSVLEAAMAPMITAALVAEEHGLDPELCSLMVGIGVPLSMLTVPLWAALVGRVV